MHPEDIRAEVRKRFTSMTDLGKKFNISPKAVSATIARPGYSRRIEKVIATAIGKCPQEVWPERYDTHGNPLSFQSRALHSSGRCETAVKDPTR